MWREGEGRGAGTQVPVTGTQDLQQVGGERAAPGARTGPAAPEPDCRGKSQKLFAPEQPPKQRARRLRGRRGGVEKKRFVFKKCGLKPKAHPAPSSLQRRRWRLQPQGQGKILKSREKKKEKKKGKEREKKTLNPSFLPILQPPLRNSQPGRESRRRVQAEERGRRRSKKEEKARTAGQLSPALHPAEVSTETPAPGERALLNARPWLPASS